MGPTTRRDSRCSYCTVYRKAFSDCTAHMCRDQPGSECTTRRFVNAIAWLLTTTHPLPSQFARMARISVSLGFRRRKDAATSIIEVLCRALVASWTYRLHLHKGVGSFLEHSDFCRVPINGGSNCLNKMRPKRVENFSYVFRSRVVHRRTASTSAQAGVSWVVVSRALSPRISFSSIYTGSSDVYR